ncbi:MAG TPA: SGNH/GDSL hydrolase family protein [Gemmatales bacterium]|nr:SGNH/GDSL hydrolase family protein [Gemmatales bacterium]
MQLTWQIIATCFLVYLGSSGSIDPQSSPQRLLFIGNSLTYTNDLPVLVQEMYVAIKQPRPVIDAITGPSMSLGDHWLTPATRTKIIQGKWNYVILQQGPSSQAESQRELMKDMETAKLWLNQSGAKPALFMVWPDTTRKRFFPQVRQAYANAAKSVDGLFLPAGLALQEVRNKEPGMSLFTDGFHPTPLGTYLSAMVITSRLTGVAPDQFPASISWAKHYSVQLTKAEHQTCIKAATLALKDEGK